MQQYQEEQEYTKPFDPRMWLRVLTYARPFWGRLAIVALAMCMGAMFDAITPMLSGFAVDTFIAHQTSLAITGAPARFLSHLPNFILFYAVIIAIQGAFIFTFIRLAGIIENGMCHRIRSIGFNRLQELSFSFYDTTPVGFIMARMTSDTSRLGETIGWTLVDLVWGSVYMIAMGSNMLRFNWKLGLLAMSVLPIIFVVSIFFQRVILRYHRQARRANSRITGAFNEGIMGAKTTKTLVRESQNFEEFKVLTSNMRRFSVKAATWSALFMPFVISLGSIGMAFVLWQGSSSVIRQIEGATGMTIGMLTIFVNYVSWFFEPVRQIARIIAELQSAQAAAERVLTLIETDPDIVDGPKIMEKYGDMFTPKTENWPAVHGDIEFKDVTFRYKNGEQVLTNFNLKVKSGQTIALVGHTGSGKSTIVNLVCRFYEPSEGQLLIDGVDYRERSQLWLHSNLGYVLQAPHLFSGTIRENIRYGRLDATDAEVERCAEMVGADGFIRKLEKGYDTDVGEGGNRLSTGEKQLVSFARAIIANPRFFILDEATSSIDTETEMLIQNAITKVLEGRTSFIVAHRLSTVRSADRILVLDGGKVIEDGTHRELIHKRGHYYKLYTNQFQEEQEQLVLGIQPRLQEE